ncbi:MAG: hypothetical protein IT446_02420 [Phycisphaerales bacterium]|jgi:hypothetical protein|nr:hypothetical protein [Phycisphaerales bacterium]
MAMTKNELRARLDREPFEPFRVNTADGKHFDVTDPQLAVPTDTRFFIVFNRGGWTDIVLRQITSIESVQAA